jgi:peptide/nickel transport system ATP-binding protein
MTERAERVLRVRDLATWFVTRAGVVRAVDGVSFDVARGEVLGLVGESGSGKSVTGFSIMGLVDPPGRVVSGSVELAGEQIVGASEARLRELRGVRMAMVFQDPMMTLNPVQRVVTQMTEAILVHERVPAAVARERARAALVKVGIPAPDERLEAWPHELSGGMRQRVAIAIALLHRPALVIADEPTTALDVTIQGQILAEVQRLAKEEGVGLVWITHDLSVVAGLADRIAVMYAGRIVEEGPVDAVLDTPRHPYTAGLIASVPAAYGHGERLNPIRGIAPSPLEVAEGCAFAPRCDRASERCRKAPPWHVEGEQHAACWHPIAGRTEAVT